MKRRSFLSFFIPDNQSDKVEKPLNASINPYTKPLDTLTATHLLRRLSFAPSPALVKQLIGKTASEAISLILGNEEMQPTAPSWINSSTENPRGADIYTRNAIEGGWRNLQGQLQTWWLTAMHKETLPASEKLTLFWSSFFTTEFVSDDTYIPPQLLYRQNALIRKNRLGNFKDFVKDITLDPSMLVYLGNVLNIKGRPNENYARELMELYTCGIGYYTEGDVKEAARVLTGWKVGMFNDEPAKNGIYNTYFHPPDHDNGSKQFMGMPIPSRDDIANTEYLVKVEEVNGLIDILFDVRADAISRFIARKVYLFFFYSNRAVVDEEFIQKAAKVFKDNKFEIRPLIEVMLGSEFFFSEYIKGAQIKSPAEYALSISRPLNKYQADMANALKGMDQDLIDPPNVAGWEAHQKWITTKTYPNRKVYIENIIKALTDDECVNFVKSFDQYDDAVELVKNIIAILLPLGVSDGYRMYLTDAVLLKNQPAYEWTTMLNSKATVALRIKDLLNDIVKNPDFHLC